jgi:Rieske 2Fe-2S family protein
VQRFVKPTVSPGALSLDASWYTSPDVFAIERDRIFASAWVYAGREEQLENPGDYFLVEVAGEDLILLRDGSSVVRAFYNVCRHRGARLCEAAQGHVGGSLQCPYHAWTYALDGALLAARNMQQVEGFDRARYPLIQARVALAGGFIFVSLAGVDEEPDPPLGPLADKLERWNIAALREAKRVDYDVASNWKLIVQNYSECYHCPLVHPQLERLSPSDSGRNDFTQGAILGGYSDLREAGAGLTTTGRRAWPPVGSVDGADVDRSYYYTVFPSMLLSLHGDYVMVHRLQPVAFNRTLISFAWLVDPTTAARPDFDPAEVVNFWDLTNRQDWHVNELTQLGLRSRAYRPGPYSNAEGLLAAFDRHYIDCMET